MIISITVVYTDLYTLEIVENIFQKSKEDFRFKKIHAIMLHCQSGNGNSKRSSMYIVEYT